MRRSALIFLAAFAMAPAQSVSDVACSLNGALTAAGVCECVAPWRGPDCGALDFLPARAPDGALYRRANTSSWCASTLRAEDGMWHAVVAQMAGSCGLNSWETNSQLIHLTSSSGPAGPYVNESVIRLPFSHNPKLTRAPDGTYQVWHIGCGDNSTKLMANCSGGVSPLPPPPPAVRFSNNGACMAPAGGVFPAWTSPFGGLSPLALVRGDVCATKASEWRVAADGHVSSAAWPEALINIDCDVCAEGAVAKLLGSAATLLGSAATLLGSAAGAADPKSTGGLNYTAEGGGLLQVLGCPGMCLSSGGGGASKPCGSKAEPWEPTQLHLVQCVAPEAQGWSLASPPPLTPSAPNCGIQYTELLTAPSLDGPWSFSTAFGPNATGSHPFFPTSVDNPAAFFWPNGTVGVMFRSYTRASAAYHSSIGIARASDWRGPWTLPTEPIFAGLEEDPFWWHQASTDSYHALFHNMGGCSAVGCHAFSRDSFTWMLSPTPAYTYAVAFDDGRNTTFSRRERPQLVFDPETGAATHLINGVQLPRADQPHDSQQDYTYSIIVPLRTL